jgi:polysaccharide biosynthesis protein PslH
MNLLVLSSRPPWPPTRADQMTVDRMIRFLAERGHAVDLACFVESAEEERVLREGLGGVCRRIDALPLPRVRSYASTLASLPTGRPMQVAYYRSAAMQRLVEARVAEGAYDAVYVHLIRMTEYVRKLAVPKAVGLQISQALNLERMYQHAKDPARKLFYRIEAKKVRPYEANVCADFDQVFLVGRRDIEELQKTAPVANAMVCPHGQDIPPLERVRETQREPGAIVVSGVMATYTNVDAVSWFAKEIFPRIEREVPEATFWIVGRNPQRAVQDLARPPRIVVTGEVPDVSDWLCRASVGVAPLRIGAGMQNKLVQAMAAELPVVATTVANEGIGAAPEREVLLRDDPEAFADAVIGLLRDASARSRLGGAARAYVEKHWTWEAHFLEMERALQRISRRG